MTANALKIGLFERKLLIFLLALARLPKETVEHLKLFNPRWVFPHPSRRGQPTVSRGTVCVGVYHVKSGQRRETL